MFRRFVALVAGTALLVLAGRMAVAAGLVVIGVSIPGGQNTFHDSLRHEADQTAASLGAQALVEDAHWDFTAQRASIDGFATRHVQGILVDNCLPDFTDRSIDAAASAGIPVATVGDVQPSSDKFLVHVGFDNLQAGRDAARFIIDKLGNKGSVIELEGLPGWPSAQNRKAGFEEVIQKSNVKLLASEVANWDRNMARRVVSRLLTKYPDVDAIFAASDDMIIGAIQAIAEAKIAPGTKVTVGVDATADALQRIKEGTLTATFDQLPSRQVAPALRYLVGYIKDKTMPPQKVILIEPLLVTKASLPSG
jgi:ribose transport system substrate-binding protein